MIPLSVCAVQLERGNQAISEVPRPSALKVLEDFQHHGAVRKRLQQMKTRKTTVDSSTDPFRKTLLERVRDKSGRTISISREDWIKCRLRWFADSDWRKVEMEKKLDNHLTTQERTKIGSVAFAVDYGVDYVEELKAQAMRTTDEYDIRELRDLMRKETQEREVPIRNWELATEAPESQPLLFGADQQLADCVTALGGFGATPEALDSSEYKGPVLLPYIEEPIGETESNEMDCTPLLPIVCKVEASYLHHH